MYQNQLGPFSINRTTISCYDFVQIFWWRKVPDLLKSKKTYNFCRDFIKVLVSLPHVFVRSWFKNLKRGKNNIRDGKKRRWRRRHRGVLRRRQQRRRLRSAGIGKKWRRVFRRAEMSVQFYLPFFIQSFLSLIRRTAGYILSRRKPCCLMTKNEREIDVVFTTTIQPVFTATQYTLIWIWKFKLEICFLKYIRV